MLNFVRRALSAFRATDSREWSDKDHQARLDAIAKGVVRRVATGSVRLQLGDFVDKRDLDRQFDRIKEYKFVSD